MNNYEFSKQLYVFLESNGITKKEFAKQAGLSESTVGKLLNGTFSPKTYCKVTKFMETKISELMEGKIKTLYNVFF